MPSRLLLKATCGTLYVGGMQLVVHGAAIPNTSKQPQFAICRSRSDLRNVDRPHGVVGGTPTPLPLRPLDELDETVPCEENVDKLVAAQA